MPIDPSIPLSGQQVSPMQSLASVVGLAGGIQNFRNAQVTNQALQQQAAQGAQDLKEREHAVSVLQNIKKYQDEAGNVDYGRLSQDIMAGAPTTGAAYINNVYQAQQSAAQARKAVNETDQEANQLVGNMLYALKGKPPTVVHDVLTGFKEKYPSLTPAIEFAGKYLIAPNVQGDKPNPNLDASLDQAGRMFQGAPTQQSMNTGQVLSVPTANGLQLVQGAQGAAQPQGTKIGEAFTPPNQIVSTPNGSAGVANTATGTVTPMKAPEMVTYYPPGESADTVKALQDQRTTQQQQLQSLPERQNIYKNIIDLADKGTPTGMYGSLWQKFGSLTGYHFTGDATADRNALGKWLEQEAARNAQAMGVHTNAGLESSKAQGGTPEYDDKTIAHIARTGAANAQGVLLYNQGLERAMQAYQQQHPGTDPVIAKRQFDSQWAKTYDVQAMRLKQAVDSGDKNGINEVIREVGGPGSANARKLLGKVHAINQLSGEQ